MANIEFKDITDFIDIAAAENSEYVTKVRVSLDNGNTWGVLYLDGLQTRTIKSITNNDYDGATSYAIIHNDADSTESLDIFTVTSNMVVSTEDYSSNFISIDGVFDNVDVEIFTDSYITTVEKEEGEIRIYYRPDFSSDYTDGLVGINIIDTAATKTFRDTRINLILLPDRKISPSVKIIKSNEICRATKYKCDIQVVADGPYYIIKNILVDPQDEQGCTLSYSTLGNNRATIEISAPLGATDLKYIVELEYDYDSIFYDLTNVSASEWTNFDDWNLEFVGYRATDALLNVKKLVVDEGLEYTINTIYIQEVYKEGNEYFYGDSFPISNTLTGSDSDSATEIQHSFEYNGYTIELNFKGQGYYWIFDFVK